MTSPFPRPSKNWWMRAAGVLAAGSVLFAATVVGAAPQVWRILNAHSQTPVELPPFGGLSSRSTILDSSGTLVGVFEVENSQPVSIDAVPATVVDAFLAVEDSGFFAHKGVNVRALVRATLANFRYSTGRQGASTITQQVVKNEYLAGVPRDGRYKILQARYAVMLEKTVEKKYIVERYLNTVFFGNNAYGVQAAAEVYFGAKVADLTLAQAGFLAGLVRAPSTYDPIRRPEQSKRRFAQVLDRFVETGLMARAEADSTLETFVIPETVKSLPTTTTNRTYFSEMVRDFLLNKSTILGPTYADRWNAIYRGGITVRTTLDSQMQAKAEAAAKAKLPANRTGITSSLVSLDSTTGALRAIVGGPGFVPGRSEVNLALRRRQTGSSIKIFVLAAALEAGALAGDLIDGTLPCSLPNPGKPSEPFEITQGVSKPTTTLGEQTWLSINCAYAKLAQIVGLNRVVNLLYRMAASPYLGPDTVAIQPYASFSTGANELSALDMASGAQTIANGGVHHEPYFIESIEGPSGVLYTHELQGVQVVSKATADSAVDILKNVLRVGTARRSPLEGRRPTAGKTGTQDNNTNAWFVGFTRQLTTAVWVGDPKAYTPMVNIPEFRRDGVSRVQGASYPARIWKAFMDAAHKDVFGGSLPMLDWDAPPVPTRNPVRLYLPGNECIAELVSGRLPQSLTGTWKNVVGSSSSTSSSSSSSSVSGPPSSVPVTTVWGGPVVSVVDPGTTIAPTDTNPTTPVVGVDPSRFLVYECAKGIPPSVRVVR